jgi:hypothetical protein
MNQYHEYLKSLVFCRYKLCEARKWEMVGRTFEYRASSREENDHGAVEIMKQFVRYCDYKTYTLLSSLFQSLYNKHNNFRALFYCPTRYFGLVRWPSSGRSSQNHKRKVYFEVEASVFLPADTSNFEYSKKGKRALCNKFITYVRIILI